MRKLIHHWEQLFLVKRPSISLSAFRLFIAITVGAVMLPTFCHLSDTYLSTAFKTYNANFFPIEFIKFIQQSPDWLVICFVWLFCISWWFFFIGFLSQLSCIVLMACCYYFYALNAFAMGTLSWDILLVTLFLMCVTNYHSDYFSVDCLMRGKEDAHARRRPYFIQRLLALQVGFTFFYTALYKITAEGNWITGNPIYVLMNYPRPGVVKYFILKDYLMDKPQLCYAIGVFIVAVELLLLFFLCIRKTRVGAIYLGCFFHIVLILTLDVPATFFFLFPAQLMLFINSEKVLEWINKKRAVNAKSPRHLVIFDGKCLFCRASVLYLKIMDLFGKFDYRDLHTITDFSSVHPKLTREASIKQLQFIDPNGDLYEGFFAFRQMSWLMPMTYFLLPLLYFPGMGIIGPIIYRFIAKHRYLIPLPMFMKKCDSQCGIS